MDYYTNLIIFLLASILSHSTQQPEQPCLMVYLIMFLLCSPALKSFCLPLSNSQALPGPLLSASPIMLLPTPLLQPLSWCVRQWTWQVGPSLQFPALFPLLRASPQHFMGLNSLHHSNLDSPATWSDLQAEVSHDVSLLLEDRWLGHVPYAIHHQINSFRWALRVIWAFWTALSFKKY